MENRPFGIPMPILAIGVGLIAYFIFFRNSGSSASPSTGGGGGTITTGNTTIDAGAVQVSVSQGQPQPPVPPKKKTTSSTAPGISLGARTSSGKHIPAKFTHGAPTKHTETLAEVSKRYKTSVGKILQLNPQLKKYQHGGKVPAGTRIVTND